MCGIAGILRVWPAGLAPPPHDAAIPEHWLDILDDSIKHRGPDGQGRFRDRARRPDGSTVDVALIHRRMAIIDLACGAQPMVTPSSSSSLPNLVGQPSRLPLQDLPLLFHGLPNDPVCYRPLAPSNNLLVVTFNGCIYNHRELRRELEAAGHRFQTDHSDTEVILHGWREWGEEVLPRLEGMFALCLWNRASTRAVLARDQFGEKPLHGVGAMVGDGGVCVFASTQGAATHVLSQLGAAMDPLAARSGLEHWVQFGFGAYPPGEYSFAVTHSRTLEGLTHPLTQHPYRRVWKGRSPPARDTPLDIPRVEALLRAAVERRLEADVPLGGFLSGGIDSSLVCLLANREVPLNTFCVRMPSAELDESQAAAEVARIIGTRHTTLDCSPTPAEDVVKLIEQVGVPFGDSSLLPSYWLCKAAGRHIRVALSGDGGDELFVGYERQAACARWGRWRWLAARLPAWADVNAEPKSLRSKIARFGRAARGQGYRDLAAIFPSEMVEQLMPGAILSPDEREGAPRFGFGMSLQDCVPWDLHEYLPDDLMRKSDAASMAVALEVRAPFLDTDLADACLRAPFSSLIPGGRRKGLLRAVARKYLPPSIVDRPKQGFAIPIGDWFRCDYGGMKTLLLDTLNSADPFPADLLGLELNGRFIQKMIDEHMNRRRDHSQRLYMLLVLAIWARWLRSLRATT